jgi:midasin
MLVFVIVDSLQQGLSKSAPAASGTSTPSGADAARNSILSMSSVSYTTNAATGKLELKMERYLDSFPFEYFVVVRDVDALPDVLAATLRQWAERIRDS